MRCKITHHGSRLRKSLRVRIADRDAYFSRKNKTISIIINDNEGYATLQPDFFGKFTRLERYIPQKNTGVQTFSLNG